jgi:hypothetical protein
MSRYEPRQGASRRTLRLDKQPQFCGEAGSGSAHAPRQPGNGGCGCGYGAVDGCAGVDVSSIMRISLPLLAAEDVIPHLGKPYHWKQGRSAKSVADCWFQANDIPLAIRALLDQSPTFANAELLDAWLERKTNLGDGRTSHSQTDLFAMLAISDELVALGIEAKVDESFGQLVSEWLADGSTGKQMRLEKLCILFNADPQVIGHLRYQLFHRTAAAIIEAKRYRARKAVMIVQSFCANVTGLSDCQSFFDHLGMPGLGRDKLIGPKTFDGVELWVGWASDRPLQV